VQGALRVVSKAENARRSTRLGRFNKLSSFDFATLREISAVELLQVRRQPLGVEIFCHVGAESPAKP